MSAHPSTLPRRPRIRGVEPYARVRPAPPELAILDRDNWLDCEDGVRRHLSKLPKGVHAWADQATVLSLLRRGEGLAVCWRGQPIRYTWGGRMVRVLRADLPQSGALEAMCAWRDWLCSYGAAPQGSLGSSSMSLLKATLTEPLWTSAPKAECPPWRFTVGGRQEVGPLGAPRHVQGDLCHFDLRAAYASRLATLEYGGWWHRLHEGKVERHARFLHDSQKMVACRARVRLSGSWPGPLVRRPKAAPITTAFEFVDYPTEGVVQGVWTMAELLQAEALGCRVWFLDGWFHSHEGRRPFAPWWAAVEDGRRMSGFAGALAKMTGNALWGQFCIADAPVKTELFYRRERGGLRIVNRPLEARRGRPPAHDLAEFLTGSVRADLTGFMALAGERLVSAHTDGGWIDETCTATDELVGVGVDGRADSGMVVARRSRTPDVDARGERAAERIQRNDDGRVRPSEEWRLKDRAEELRLLDPQTLAYRRPGESVWQYVVSGWPSEGAEGEFERRWSSALNPESRFGLTKPKV